MSDPKDITVLINAAVRGDMKAASQLLPIVYEELRVLASQRLAKERPGLTLQATALVHEAYLRLVGGGDDPKWSGRNHFYAAAAIAMRRILVERARAYAGPKRGGGMRREELGESAVMPIKSALQLFPHEFEQALAKLPTNGHGNGKVANAIPLGQVRR